MYDEELYKRERLAIQLNEERLKTKDLSEVLIEKEEKIAM